MIVNVYAGKEIYEIEVPLKDASLFVDIVTEVNDFFEKSNIPGSPDIYQINNHILSATNATHLSQPVSAFGIGDNSVMTAYSDLGPRLIQAIRDRDAKQVGQILGYSSVEPYVGKLNLDALQIDKKPLLWHLAKHVTFEGSVEIAERLLNAGADPHILESKNDKTLLVSMITQDHLTEKHVAFAVRLIGAVKFDSKREDPSTILKNRLEVEKGKAEKNQHNILMLVKIQKILGLIYQYPSIFDEIQSGSSASSSETTTSALPGKEKPCCCVVM